MAKKKEDTVSIRVSAKARKKLKFLAVKENTTIVKVVDSLLKA